MSDQGDTTKSAADTGRRMRATEYFLARLAEEARRAERYGRRFAVIFVSCRQANPREVFNNVRPRLRCTDIVEVIRGRSSSSAESAYAASVADPSDTTPRDQVAVILPETGRRGTVVALDRLRSDLVALQDLRLGMAVFPDDSKNPHELLSLAAAGAGDSFRA